jgi:hypothetical protein
VLIAVIRPASARRRNPLSRCLSSRSRATPMSQGSAGSRMSSMRRQAMKNVSLTTSSAACDSVRIST